MPPRRVLRGPTSRQGPATTEPTYSATPRRTQDGDPAQALRSHHALRVSADAKRRRWGRHGGTAPCDRGEEAQEHASTAAAGMPGPGRPSGRSSIALSPSPRLATRPRSGPLPRATIPPAAERPTPTPPAAPSPTPPQHLHRETTRWTNPAAPPWTLCLTCGNKPITPDRTTDSHPPGTESAQQQEESTPTRESPWVPLCARTVANSLSSPSTTRVHMRSLRSGPSAPSSRIRCGPGGEGENRGELVRSS
ncbi:hypothetical protein P3T29_005938 [Kitasatospora sp. MAP5-34]|nr:hypothetical protein [Kitasatospora sp. MAP5-34]